MAGHLRTSTTSSVDWYQRSERIIVIPTVANLFSASFLGQRNRVSSWISTIVASPRIGFCFPDSRNQSCRRKAVVKMFCGVCTDLIQDLLSWLLRIFSHFESVSMSCTRNLYLFTKIFRNDSIAVDSWFEWFTSKIISQLSASSWRSLLGRVRRHQDTFSGRTCLISSGFSHTN